MNTDDSITEGIGRGVAQELTKLGAKVWGVSRTKANLDSLKVI